jgi:hypothetical protein
MAFNAEDAAVVAEERGDGFSLWPLREPLRPLRLVRLLKVSLRLGCAGHSWSNPGVDDEPIELPIDGVLDLHTFQPREVKDLVHDYLAECQRRGILRVRVIHGKGIGNLRRTVHALLAKHSEVLSFNLAGDQFGGWGATMVYLKPVTKNGF